jgi:glycosyltransferase involved in cell wall biosynthesis
MRVLHVTPYFAPAFRYGGPPRSILGLCKGLQHAGVDVEVLTTTADGAQELPVAVSRASSYDGVPVHYASRRFPRRFFGAALSEVLDAALDAADVCHVHGIWHVPEWLATRAAHRRGVPYVISPRGMLLPGAAAHHRWRKRIAYHLLERAALTRATALHATADEEAQVLRRLIPGLEVAVVRNGVELLARGAPFGSARAAQGIPPADPVVLFVGRLHPTKRIDLLARSVARVHAACPRTHLVLAGPDEGGHAASLSDVLRPLGQRVHVIGDLADAEKRAWLDEATLLALCSDSESFGLSVLEAMAASLPVVVTRTCPWEEVERSRCGLWVDQDEAALAAAIAEIIEQPRLAQEMGARGRDLVEARYSWQAVGAEMAALYTRLLSGGRRAA